MKGIFSKIIFSLFPLWLLALSLNIRAGYVDDADYVESYPEVEFKDIREKDLEKLFFQHSYGDLTSSLKNFTLEDWKDEKKIAWVRAQCSQMEEEERRFTNDFYENKTQAKNVLFLGDFPSAIKGSLGLGLKTASYLPVTKVYSTDIAYPEKEKGEELQRFFKDHPAFEEYLGKKDNLFLQKLDHTQPFPFPDEKFDAIVMKSGLCICNHETQINCINEGKRKKISFFYSRNCAGLEISETAYTKFLGEVARVLNYKNPRSFALLEGMEFKVEKKDESGVVLESMRMWERACAKIAKAHPGLKVEMLFLREKNLATGKLDRLFKAIRIFPKKRLSDSFDGLKTD